jgi:hypothetical protein
VWRLKYARHGCLSADNAVKRLFLHEAIADQFIKSLKVRVESLRVGNGIDPFVEKYVCEKCSYTFYEVLKEKDKNKIKSKNKDKRVKAHDSLVAIGDSATSCLVEALASSNQTMRWEA